MLKSTGRIKKTSSSRPFRDFHSSWISTLRSSLLPLLRHSMSNSSRGQIVFNRGGAMVASSDLLSTHVSTLHSHFQAFYHALDLAARHDVAQILAPHARSPLEVPYLWFGDFHPSLFTNLLRSLNPAPETLVSKIEEIERGTRLIIPNILQRYRDAQGRLAERIAGEWKGGLEEEGMKEAVEELESVFGDANRLRRSILSEIVGAADVYQAALFLEALAEFVVGFWDERLIQEFEKL